MGLNRFMRAMMVVFITANCITINPDIIFAATDSEDSSLNTDEWEEEKTEEQPSEVNTGPRYETAREVSSRDIKELEKSNKVRNTNKADLIAMLKEKAEKGPNINNNNSEQTENAAINEEASGADRPAIQVERRHPGLPSDSAAEIKKRRKAIASSDSELESLTYPDKPTKVNKKKVAKESVADASESDLDSSMQSADESSPQPLKANQQPFFPKVFKKIKDAGKWVRDKIDENPEVKKAIVDKSAGLIDQLLTKKKSEEVNASDFPPPPTDEELRLALPETPMLLGFNAPATSEPSSFEFPPPPTDEELRLALPETPMLLGFNAPATSEPSSFEFPPPPTEDELEIIRETASSLDSSFTRGDLASLRNAINRHSQNFSDFPPIPTEEELNGRGGRPTSEEFSSLNSGDFTDDENSETTEEEIDRLADLRDRGTGKHSRNAGFLPLNPFASSPVPSLSPKVSKISAPALISDITKKTPFKNPSQPLNVFNKKTTTKTVTKKPTPVKTAPKLAELPATKPQETVLRENKTPFIEKQAETNKQSINMPSLPVIQKEATESDKEEMKPQTEEKMVEESESANNANGKNRSAGIEEGKLIAKSAEDEKAKEEPGNHTTLILAMLAIGVFSLGAFIKIIQLRKNN
ncbi:actin assembly-inducing protein ActA [Listeria monocytogenes]|uniref:Actin assembly-inducing protein n=35 Tax=Listeria monocytogenes TaxID=1639 RepID=ACTA_LISMO|nr:actin assembly-inducing protein ActA [Listeria monocytogenes]NP_463735.1 actin-assembly inducing protein precursor [Listeria monocytogenes EGD-e]P33379.1 RecName: Full=Actin assembly-inducing protein; Flags: Precursor [Listeria monocytogenes EGD-e]EAD5037609.1 actin assembly-inducing protein ActA [Listeria monocytogenes serotype 1/2a]EAE3703752.1 actin assembly-inducing protein ActA [Listeria monocytogenes serotype 1/2c]GAF01375.1 actin-assembly inducing precursor [Listeria monocytogenes 36